MQAIVEEAHKLGRKVAAHAHGTSSIRDAILAGVDSVEHASLIDDEGVGLAKAHGTALVGAARMVRHRRYARIGTIRRHRGGPRDPTADVRLLEHISFVMKGGVVVRHDGQAR